MVGPRRLRARGRSAVAGASALVILAAGLSGSGQVQAAPTAPIIRVSITPTGGNPHVANGAGTSISADGRYVVFQSDADNLVPGDGNQVEDIFVRDLVDNTTRRVSRASTGSLLDASGADPNSSSLYPSISANGRFVVFGSAASNLVPGDTNGSRDTFRADLMTGVITRQSVSTSGVQSTNGSISVPSPLSPSISNDGARVVFTSGASNLVSGDTNGVADSFVHDNSTGVTSRVSVASNGSQSTGTSDRASISGTGRFVVFESAATNFVAGDDNGDADVFVRDLQTSTTTLASVAADGGVPSDPSINASISDDGRYVAYASASGDIVVGDTNFIDDVFVRDRTDNITTRVSVGVGGANANAFSSWPSLDASGSTVAFASRASNLVAGDANGKNDVFVASRTGGSIRRVPLSTSGGDGNGHSYEPELSDTGRFVVLGSDASNLLPSGSDPTSPGNDSNGAPDIFRIDLAKVPAEPGKPSIKAGGAPLLSWTAPPGNGNPSPTSYTVKAYQGSLDSTPDRTLVTGSTTRTLAVSGLVAGRAYRFTVAAENANGVGADSQFTEFAVLPYPTVQLWFDDLFVRTVGRNPTASEAAQISTWANAVLKGQRTTESLIADRMAGTFVAKIVAPVARLYRAYYLRTPDSPGLRYWIGKRSSGTSLASISASFAGSSEFENRYGTLSNRAFVRRVYQNVLGRPPDSGGENYWTSRLDGGTPRGQVMTSFSESAEYLRTSKPVIDVITTYYALLRRAPSAATVATWSSSSLTAVIAHVYASEEFADGVPGH
jgi:hypothetical protein